MPYRAIHTVSKARSTLRSADAVGDFALIAFRWVLFADLCILFGSSLLFAIVFGKGRNGQQEFSMRRGYGALAGIGIVASLAGFLWQAAAMAGGTLLDLDVSLLSDLIVETSLGWAAVARVAALALIFCVVLARNAIPPSGGLPVLSGAALALATLAWSGHGAADEGLQGWFHLGADIVHLVAAGAWLGALVGFLWLVARSRALGTWWSDATHRALAGFAKIGTALVGLLVVSGVLNFYFIASLRSLTEIIASPYARLLALKLALFAAMLVLAAANRFLLAPALGMATDPPSRERALRELRGSLALEFSLGLAVVGLVAWLGTLSPQGAS